MRSSSLTVLLAYTCTTSLPFNAVPCGSLPVTVAHALMVDCSGAPLAATSLGVKVVLLYSNERKESPKPNGHC